MRKLFLSILVCSISLFALLSFTPDAAQRYIEKYASLSIQESVKSGIPASVILAQGIVESGAGNSELTRRSNNHFGIKWNESMPYKHTQALDDDYNSAGEKIPSNFVVYSGSEESFKHHSQFLMSNQRYRSLFQLTRTDYVGWSKGLQSCNYATEKTYAQSLINTINKYHLDSYDIPAMLEPDDEEVSNTSSLVQHQQLPAIQPEKRRAENTETYPMARINDIKSNNDDNSEGLFEIISASTSSKTGTKARNKSAKKQFQPAQEEGLFEIK